MKMLKIRNEIQEKWRRVMKGTKFKVLSYDIRTDTAKCRFSSTIFIGVAHENLKLHGLRRGGHLAHNCETKSE